jgi:hypothetical protein
MSLSLLAKGLVFLCLALIAGVSGSKYAAPIAAYVTDARDVTARDARISKRSIAYRIPQDGKLVFAFSQARSTAKILVAPSVGEEVRALEEGFVYGIRVRWIGSEDQILSSHDVYLQADSPDTVYTSGEKWRFFRTRPELVAEQDQLLVESPEPAARLELEGFDIDGGIVGIDVRVFEQRTYLGNQSLAAFRRLSDDTRAVLAAPNAFPADMLSEEEEFYLGKNHWRALGPVGRNGRDYTMLVLYEALREDIASDAAGAYAAGGAI